MVPLVGIFAFATVPSTHNFTLSRAMRAAGLVHLGANSSARGDNSYTHLFAKLDAGEAISIAVLGASVAQNGGCLTQPGKRCMLRSGTVPDVLSWGEPRKRPFKGFLVRWIEWINATWPHSGHRLYNTARDANSLSTTTACLASMLPRDGADLLLIEAGSMFLTHTPGLVEQLLRSILSMRAHVPAVVFVNVHLWCTFGGSLAKKTNSYGLANLPNRVHGYFAGRPGELANASEADLVQPAFISRWHEDHAALKSPRSHKKSPNDRLEDGINELCERYRVACLSTRDALSGAFYAGWQGFSIEDIANDCLHPSHGRLGTEYMTDVLVHWTLAAYKEAVAGSGADALPLSAASGAQELPGQAGAMGWHHYHHAAVNTAAGTPLPPPLFEKAWPRPAGEIAACYALKDVEARSVDESHVSVALLPWRTANCPEAALRDALEQRRLYAPHPSALSSAPAHEADGASAAASAPAEQAATTTSAISHLLSTCKRLTMASRHDPEQPQPCPSTPGTPLALYPSTWTHCSHDDATSKISNSVSAFRAGATLMLDLPTAWLPTPTATTASVENHAASSATSPLHRISFNATLQYLSSWVPGTGRVQLTCLGRCSCDAGTGGHEHVQRQQPHQQVMHEIDGRHVSSLRNASIYVEHAISIDYRPPRPHAADHAISPGTSAAKEECALVIRVKGDEADAGGGEARGEPALRRFRLRYLVLSTMNSPCHQEGASAKFLAVRNGLWCATPGKAVKRE